MTPAAAAAELMHRRRLRSDFGSWCEHALAPFDQTPAAHHRLLIRELQAVADGGCKRLMINMPPGSAKSTYGSVQFPAWLFAGRPRFNLIGASNTAGLAEDFSRRIMGTVRDNATALGYGLVRDNAEEWETSNGGRYRAVGVGGTIAGKRADGVLIDDPVRSRADAESLTVRESQWNWFTADLRTRLKPNAFIVVIMTRWHPDDLGGRLLTRQPGLWRVVSLPAIAGENDALGRAPGEWLWSDDAYGYGAEIRKVHAEYEAAGAMRDWASLYQQTPTAAQGSLFKTASLQVLDAAPAAGQTVRAWDLAATRQTGTRNPDWTVGLKLSRDLTGRFCVTDVVRLRGGPDEVEAAILGCASQDGRLVRVGLPQDPGQAGKQQVLHLTRKLVGHAVESSPETGDKALRAAPVAAQVNVGNVDLLRGDWNAAFIEELRGFPGGEKDDQVDALSRAFSMLAVPASRSGAAKFRAMT